MLKPIDFKNNYFELLKESKAITGRDADVFSFHVHKETTEADTFTAEQWSNLVKVASIIKANVNRFDMAEWHIITECGTAHCIAGWAESLAENDTNYCEFGPSANTRNIAIGMLSVYAEPFFWVTTENLFPEYCFCDWVQEIQQHEGLAERLVMKYFIDPILEEASKESYELSSEVTHFIERAQKDLELIAS